MDKKRKKIRIFLCALSCVCAISAAGCANSDFNIDYNIYYTNSNGNELTTRIYSSSTSEKDKLVRELLDQMDVNNNSSQTVIIKPEALKVLGIRIEYDSVIVEYNEEYDNLNPITEVLYRTAVVKTLTQIDGINSVDFRYNNKALTDKNGNILTGMTADDYIDETNDGSDKKDDRITLYYANEKGNRLIRKEEIFHDSINLSPEKVVINKLIEGPGGEEGVQSTMSTYVELIGINVTDGVCYVDFNESFLTSPTNTIGEVTIYSIVNSLCELDHINGVKILVNGSSKGIYYRDIISLDQVFRFNQDYVQK